MNLISTFEAINSQFLYPPPLPLTFIIRPYDATIPIFYRERKYQQIDSSFERRTIYSDNFMWVEFRKPNDFSVASQKLI